MADESCGNADEGEEVLSFALVAAVQAAAAGQPGHGALHHPAVAAQPLGGLDALAGDAVVNAALAEPSAQVVVVVSLSRQIYRLPDAPKAYGATITRPMATPAQSRSADRSFPRSA